MTAKTDPKSKIASLAAKRALPKALAPDDGDKSRKAGLSCVKRLPAYLHLLRALQAEGREYVSGTVLSKVHHLEPVIVRKDLAITGIVGTPKIGFRVDELILAIERFLGWDNQTKAVLVGVGNLGSALLGYRGFAEYGLRIVASFDSDPKKSDNGFRDAAFRPRTNWSNMLNDTRSCWGCLQFLQTRPRRPRN